jgi:hypothetical protein
VNRILDSQAGYNGSHVGNRNRNDVRGVRFPADVCASSNLTEIPNNLLNIFPNLIALEFINCPITTLSGFELENYPNLEVFELSFTDLERIPGNFFNITNSISHINFSDNKIKFTGTNLLNHLNNLRRLYFERNICIDMHAQNNNQINALIQCLNNNCRDNDEGSTTTFIPAPPSVPTASLPSTTSTPNSECDIDEVDLVVCNLKDQVEKIEIKIENLTNENQNIKFSINGLEEEVKDLSKSNENLLGTVNEMQEKLNEQAKVLKEFERLLIDLTARPCGCR